MNIPKKLSFSIYLMLMLIGTILSVPVDNNCTYMFKNVKLASEVLFSRASSVESQTTLMDLFPRLSNQTYKKFAEQLLSFATNEMIYAKGKFKDIVTYVNSAETKLKLPNVFTELHEEILARRFAYLVREDIARVRENIDGFLAHMNSAETNKKFNELLNELPDEELAKAFRDLAEYLKNLVKQELNDVEAKVDELERQIKPKIYIKFSEELQENVLTGFSHCHSCASDVLFEGNRI